jgi:hypothetical protein
VRLFAWSRTESRWIEAELPGGAGYREDDAVPVLLRLDGAASGTVYETTVRYQCATEKGAGLDFLSTPAEVDSGAVSTDPGPARLQPDSAIQVPNDAAISFDDRTTGRFELWGGTFQQSPHGPVPESACERRKELRLMVGAANDTIFLFWAAHFASPRDWGEGRGAASQDEPLSIEVAVLSAGEARLSIAPEAVQP